MTELWLERPVPQLGPTTSIGVWEPADVAELTAQRRRLAHALGRPDRPSGIDEGAVERLLLVFEELGSNGLRHGRGPVCLSVTTAGGYWLLQVSDAAIHRPPVPATDRDAGSGGLGLYLVARICGAHGWTVDGSRKITWARIDSTRAEAPEQVARMLPQPRWRPAEPFV